MEKKIDISVIIPIYNAEEFLVECLDSIQNQSYANFEVILINDGSTDSSDEICKRYTSADSRFRYYSQTNKGVSAARNRGIEYVEGEWITFVDADDYLVRDAFKIMLDKITQNNGSEMLLANSYRLINDDLNVIHYFKKSSSTDLFHSMKHFALWGYLIRLDVLKKNNIYFIEGLAYSEDRVFLYALILHVKSILFLNTPIYVHRVNHLSVCQSSNGLKKAYHHFMASKYLSDMASVNKNRKTFFRMISKEKNGMKDLGVYLFIETLSSKDDFKKMKAYYFDFFGTRLKSKMSFTLIYFKNLLLFRYRQIKSNIL